MTRDDTITRIPLDPKARHEGYLAGRRGQTADDNPYQVGTREALAWGIGQMDGRTKRLEIVATGKRPSNQ
jgi:ribosome modulation factor